MIDIHCHILPGVDDGAVSLPESLAMAREAANEGIQKIIATPHHQNGSYMNPGANIIGATDYLNGKLQKEQIPVQILPGQETRIYGDIIEDIKRGDILPLNGDSGYVLVELPSNHVPGYTTQLLFDMQIAGYKPIIAHPEKNHEILENPDKLYRIVKNGALTQISASSLIGKAGRKIQRFSHQLLETNQVHFMGSDAHNNKRRGFYLRQAYSEVRKSHGNTLEYQLMENSEALLIGNKIQMDAPERISLKKKWGLFKV
ncbi:tyrosine protein phosphatase [Virgibacillus sp. NKC19-16]|uniref:tyrosine-protein phosphatase n=1 Tax=Virgibacillus salidurans TaxID=2831673 RepID=UPI001F1BC1AD|nr:CpsB/CapC family capsule biosynthesis tyrosine phosphatase [Virgibacillus sp. NKC19-16]UJL45825.1 tyrosine protein phosphatase [Virgibacillus sp. NKC19-16]